MAWEDGRINVLTLSPCWQLEDKSFKGSVRERATGHMISSCTILRFIGIKVKFQASPIFWF